MASRPETTCKLAGLRPTNRDATRLTTVYQKGFDPLLESVADTTDEVRGGVRLKSRERPSENPASVCFGSVESIDFVGIGR